MIRIWVRPGLRGPLPPLEPDNNSGYSSGYESEAESKSHQSSSSDSEMPETPSPKSRNLLGQSADSQATGSKGGKTILQEPVADVEAPGQKRKRSVGAPLPRKVSRRSPSTSVTDTEESEDDLDAGQQPVKRITKIRIQTKGRTGRHEGPKKKLKLTTNKSKSPRAADCEANDQTTPRSQTAPETIVVKPHSTPKRDHLTSPANSKGADEDAVKAPRRLITATPTSSPRPSPRSKQNNLSSPA